MSALTRRYIDQVVGHLPDGRRGDISRELDTLIADMQEERLAAGADGAAAEREALEELGDPARLAATYRNAPNHLIGPGLYPLFTRMLAWLLPLVLLVALVVNIVVYTATEPEAALGGMIGQVVGALLNALVWTLGSVTALFWLLERVLPERDLRSSLGVGATRWTVEALDTEIVNARGARSEAVTGLVFLAVLAVLPLVPTSFLYVGHLNDGGPFVNQALWGFWLPAYYVLLVMAAAVDLWTAVQGMSRPIVVARAVLDIAAGVFLTALVLTQQVIDPAIDSGILQTAGAVDWVDVLYLAVIWMVVAWDLYVCVKYWRTLRATAD
ncbi:HAAS signaling domain-containing protein [Citricoccus nitrophenolicus]|uniref:HAAS signaling domain-containing protein n=1 Tax=Citricoccus nitrophenolicus TaxID=863575 RepID=UPI0039B3B516